MSKSVLAPLPAAVIRKKEIIEGYIEKYLPKDNVYPQTLHAAIRYSVMAGGKRLRPVLAMVAYETCGGHDEVIYPAAAALEFVHTYSLIHDDLPCMDDDDLRRGRATLHRKYGEAVALLAGDALHDMAFRLMAQTGSATAVSELAEAIGTRGMLAGQIADMEAEGRKISLEEITFIHTHKTGKLIRGSVRIGALLSGATPAVLESISRYGEKIGLAFQIIDDILDIEGDQEILGKPIGSDSRNLKATFPGVVGMDESRRIADSLIEEAIKISRTEIPDAQSFTEIAQFIRSRQN